MVSITFRGEPVALISPINKLHYFSQDHAKTALLTRLRTQTPAEVAWTRADLYDA